MEQLTPHQVLIRRFVELHPEEVARQLDDADVEGAVGMLQSSDETVAATVLQRMEPDRGAHILTYLDDAALSRLLAQLDPAFIARLLTHLDESASARILALAGAERGREIQEILSYPPGTAGSLMDAQVSTFAVDCTVATALERIRRLGNRRATDLVLRDENDRYAGVVRLPDVVAADPELLLGDLRDSAAVQVQPMTPRDEIVELLNTYRLTSLPVVDFVGQVVGVIRHDGLVSAAQQNLAANVQEMVGVSAEERALSKPWVSIRSRLPWLHINLVTAFLAAAVVGLFEDTIAKFTALAVLLPVVAGQSGNTGAQALAVTMRGLALREIRTSPRDPRPRQGASSRLLQRAGHCRGDRDRRLRLEPELGAGPRHVVRHVGVHDTRVPGRRGHSGRAVQAGLRSSDRGLDHSHDRDRHRGFPLVFGLGNAAGQYAPSQLERLYPQRTLRLFRLVHSIRNSHNGHCGSLYLERDII